MALAVYLLVCMDSKRAKEHGHTHRHVDEEEDSAASRTQEPQPQQQRILETPLAKTWATRSILFCPPLPSFLV
jgi:hypothetical protein